MGLKLLFGWLPLDLFSVYPWVDTNGVIVGSDIAVPIMGSDQFIFNFNFNFQLENLTLLNTPTFFGFKLIYGYPLDPTYCIPVGRLILGFRKKGSERKVPIKVPIKYFNFTLPIDFNLVGLT